jgi:hypothetical protein
VKRPIETGTFIIAVVAACGIGMMVLWMSW